MHNDKRVQSFQLSRIRFVMGFNERVHKIAANTMIPNINKIGGASGTLLILPLDPIQMMNTDQPR